MVFCIYYYHELVKERTDRGPHRLSVVTNRRAEDFTRTVPYVNTIQGGF
jgi:hypothetical protein